MQGNKVRVFLNVAETKQLFYNIHDSFLSVVLTVANCCQPIPL